MSQADLKLVTKQQAAQQDSWRSAPVDGHEVRCGGETFLVLPGVFPPRSDTRMVIDQIAARIDDDVLDMGTGSGVLAVFAAKSGSKRVVAVDINPAAVENAARNAARHDLAGRIETRLPDGFAAIGAGERFDLVIANLPGRNQVASDLVGAAQWDTAFRTHETFFSTVSAHLKPGGQVLMAKASYPEINRVVELAEAAGLGMRVLDEKTMPEPDPRKYYCLCFAVG